MKYETRSTSCSAFFFPFTVTSFVFQGRVWVSSLKTFLQYKQTIQQGYQKAVYNTDTFSCLCLSRDSRFAHYNGPWRFSFFTSRSHFLFDTFHLLRPPRCLPGLNPSFSPVCQRSTVIWAIGHLRASAMGSHTRKLL